MKVIGKNGKWMKIRSLRPVTANLAYTKVAQLAEKSVKKMDWNDKICLLR